MITILLQSKKKIKKAQIIST